MNFIFAYLSFFWKYNFKTVVLIHKCSISYEITGPWTFYQARSENEHLEYAGYSVVTLRICVFFLTWCSG